MGGVGGEALRRVRPQELTGRLGASRHFRYTHFSWATTKVAWIERQYGKPLGEVVREQRATGATVAGLAREWGLAVGTLYKAASGQYLTGKGRG